LCILIYVSQSAASFSQWNIKTPDQFNQIFESVGNITANQSTPPPFSLYSHNQDMWKLPSVNDQMKKLLTTPSEKSIAAFSQPNITPSIYIPTTLSISSTANIAQSPSLADFSDEPLTPPPIVNNGNTPTSPQTATHSKNYTSKE